MTILAVSPQLMTTWRSDLNRIFIDAITVLRNPIIELLPEEVDLASSCFALADKIVGGKPTYKMDGIGYLMTSFFYLVGGFIKKRLSDGTKDGMVNTRHGTMFNSFLELVEKHHTTERMVSFYADKHVVLEAQHLLRHTDLTVKEIAGKLNFTNQSFFHKYFKSHTGMTPDEYRMK